MNDALHGAARWFVVLASGEAGEEERHRWLAWRAADPAHEAAWQRTGAALAPFGRIPDAHRPLSATVLAPPPAAPRRARRRALAGIAGVFALGLGSWQAWWASDASADARTAVGEQRHLQLADGSRVLLDTGTLLDVAYTANRRHLHLRRGRILVTTAADARPFTVATSQGHVQALGTRFVVEQRAGATEVGVLASRVALHPGGQASAAAVLEAGDTVRFDAQGRIAHRAAPAGEPAWTRGMLAADDIPLGELVAELARYRSEPLACEPAAAVLRISGHFPLLDGDRALAAIVATLPVRLERQQRSGSTTLWVRRR